ncbi:hypothetical protein [Leptospira santarosai]|uniref:hypothetical protein n=1 Tax=Leptospira santarosai TaxID=28183 RepID=UPI0007749E85|nr:hypothetical protein [Leptospira santarosai]
MTRYQKLLSRRAPQDERFFKSFSEAFELSIGENTKYILGAMRPVEKRFTDKLLNDGNRIQAQLDSRIDSEYPNIEFRRQGSVTNDTHIRYYSDIDVLVLIDKFYTVEYPVLPNDQYMGSVNRELSILRYRCKEEIELGFPATDVDDSGAFSISVKGGSLSGKVDVVPSCWYLTFEYRENPQEYLKGVTVLNRKTQEQINNFPFKFNHLLNARDSNTYGITKMLIRFLKSIKADEEEEGSKYSISSYDLCSVVYRMPDDLFLRSIVNSPIIMIYNLLSWFNYLILNESRAKALMVVDNSRKIFNEQAKLQDISRLYKLINELCSKATSESGQTFISKSHIAENSY